MLNNIKGYDIPVVSGICNTREKIAQSLGCQVDEILYKIIDGMNNPTPVSKFIDLLPITNVMEEHILLLVLYLQETLKQAFKMLLFTECWFLTRTNWQSVSCQGTYTPISKRQRIWERIWIFQ